MRNVRFGVIADAVRSKDDLLALARRAEATGFSTLLLRDHVVAEPFGHQLGPIVSMTAAAMATTTLRVGSLVFSSDFRPIVQLAKEMATLDILSGGRVEVGLGAGFLASEYVPLGKPFDRAGIRVDRLESSIQVLRKIFSATPFDYRDAYHALDAFEGFPAPAQCPHPPILVAGSGDRMLAIAAREADIVGLQTVTTTSGNAVMDPANYRSETIDRKVELVRRAAGARFDALELNTTVTPIVTVDREAVAREVIARRGWSGVTVPEVLAMPTLLIGTNDEIAAQIHERRHRFGLTYLVVSQGDLETIAPVALRFAQPLAPPAT